MKMNRSWFLRVLLCAGIAMLLLPVAAFSQSNSTIDELLAQKKALFGDSVYMVLAAANIIPANATPVEAMNALYQKDWISPPPKADAPISFGDFSYILMKSFDIPGGLMYHLFPGPRYAGREVVYRQWAPKNLSPYEGLSGMQALYILRTYLDSRGKS